MAFIPSVHSADGSGLIRFPKSVRTRQQRILYLLKSGYVLTAYLMARFSDKIVVRALKDAYPQVPWNNYHFAAKHLK